ncbi:MAG: ABC transporter ATP-binding protein [Xanthobacteraceae bacterium]
MDADVVLEVRELRTHFVTDRGTARAVDGVSFRVRRGRTLAVVGESGSGKSVTSLSIMRLIPTPPGRIVGGEILFRDRDGQVRDLARLPEPAMRRIRGDQIGMIFQEPMTSLNPVMTVGDQIAETVRLHRGASRSAARNRAIEMLRLVKIADPQKRLGNYPHQFSGGQRQRVMIAMALACTPKLLIADEPTTALDVTIQAQILELIGELQGRLGMAVLLISHDLGVVAERTDEVAVMYAGKIVESAKPELIFTRPKHPYTIGLLDSLPGRCGGKKRLATIPGMVPSPLDWPTGCRFRDRCARADARCAAQPPPLIEIERHHRVACFKAA